MSKISVHSSSMYVDLYRHYVFGWHPRYVLARLFIASRDPQKSMVFLVPERKKEKSRFRHAVKE